MFKIKSVQFKVKMVYVTSQQIIKINKATVHM